MKLLGEIKQFCIEKLREYKTWRSVDSNDQLGEFSNWENELDSKNDIKSIYDYVYKVAKKVWEISAWRWSVANLTFLNGEGFLKSFGEKEYYQFLTDMINEYELKSSGVETEKDTFKSLAENYRLGLKKIIGVDPNGIDWESKIVKSDDSNKDITGLQTQITNLTKLKEETEKQLKEKQDQILNHRCDTPNNAELNQTKEELNKTNKEIISLKEQLDNKPNNHLPNSPNDKEEEQENNNLTLEQLKTKLNAKRQEIKMLKEQLDKTLQSDNHSHQNSSGNSKIFLGIVIGILIIVALGGLAFIISKKKKKKKNS